VGLISCGSDPDGFRRPPNTHLERACFIASRRSRTGAATPTGVQEYLGLAWFRFQCTRTVFAVCHVLPASSPCRWAVVPLSLPTLLRMAQREQRLARSTGRVVSLLNVRLSSWARGREDGRADPDGRCRSRTTAPPSQCVALPLIFFALPSPGPWSIVCPSPLVVVNGIPCPHRSNWSQHLLPFFKQLSDRGEVSQNARTSQCEGECRCPSRLFHRQRL
jgi:hypothetical protein